LYLEKRYESGGNHSKLGTNCRTRKQRFLGPHWLPHWLAAAGTNSRWDIYLVQNWAARWFLTYSRYLISGTSPTYAVGVGGYSAQYGSATWSPRKFGFLRAKTPPPPPPRVSHSGPTILPFFWNSFLWDPHSPTV